MQFFNKLRMDSGSRKERASGMTEANSLLKDPKFNGTSSFRPNAVRAGIHNSNRLSAADASRLEKLSLSNTFFGRLLKQ
jgi:hypothetical protein